LVDFHEFDETNLSMLRYNMLETLYVVAIQPSGKIIKNPG
jgi:hypothetical protein